MEVEFDKKFGEQQSPPHAENQKTEQAESALQLLRSLASAAVSPENLEQAFLDWARLSDDARTNPEFGYILTNILSSSSASDERHLLSRIGHSQSIQSVDFEDIFFLDANGVVVDVGAELSLLLNIKVGDSIEPGMFQDLFEQDRAADAEPQSNWMQTIELRDKFNIKRRIVLHKVSHGMREHRYAAVYVRVVISRDAKSELLSHYGLTKSELEILELAAQRYSPEQIASLRNSKLNTVRTHISRLINKLECSSLNEAIGSAIELSLAKSANPVSFFGSASLREHSIRKVTIPEHEAVVEYRRYGPLSGKPVIVLHSIEYGYQPTPNFIEMAREQDICLYFPLRPGFGDTTSAVSLDAAATIMGGFLKALDISGATIVALSTSAPVALAIPNARERIDHSILVNYGLNADGKIDSVQPTWVRGMIKMALAAPSSFTLGLESVRTFFRTFGTKRFYRMLYAGIGVDAKFMEQNEALFEQSGEHLMKANRLNIRMDFMSSFMSNRDLPHHIANQRRVTVMNGELQHMVSPAKAIQSASNLGVELEIVPNGGRNWPFVQPEALFSVIGAVK